MVTRTVTVVISRGSLEALLIRHLSTSGCPVVSPDWAGEGDPAYDLATFRWTLAVHRGDEADELFSQRLDAYAAVRELPNLVALVPGLQLDTFGLCESQRGSRTRKASPGAQTSRQPGRSGEATACRSSGQDGCAASADYLPIRRADGEIATPDRLATSPIDRDTDFSLTSS